MDVCLLYICVRTCVNVLYGGLCSFVRHECVIRSIWCVHMWFGIYNV